LLTGKKKANDKAVQGQKALQEGSDLTQIIQLLTVQSSNKRGTSGKLEAVLKELAADAEVSKKGKKQEAKKPATKTLEPKKAAPTKAAPTKAPPKKSAKSIGKPALKPNLNIQKMTEFKAMLGDVAGNINLTNISTSVETPDNETRMTPTKTVSHFTQSPRRSPRNHLEFKTPDESRKRSSSTPKRSLAFFQDAVSASKSPRTNNVGVYEDITPIKENTASIGDSTTNWEGTFTGSMGVLLNMDNGTMSDPDETRRRYEPLTYKHEMEDARMLNNTTTSGSTHTTGLCECKYGTVLVRISYLYPCSFYTLQSDSLILTKQITRFVI
jgi:hypothetical protein